ncbi:MAG: ThiF family adenylyltransferase [Flavobacteriales bacterium]|nr:ThiF family adenylyltransferase [Flavobacteriales bacterium]
MNTWLEGLRSASAADPDRIRPVFFRLANSSDQRGLEELLRRHSGITVHNQLNAQLRELLRARCPAVKWTEEDLEAAVIAHLNGCSPELYGCWVFYPWSNRLVHLLDEPEFAEVRTDRNRNKITTEEQAILATKRVGVIGLSVGQSVSLAMAMERSCGELRLADFDTLDLSNLNRIRSGVHHLGIRKTVNAAREIAEIDPYLMVTCYHEGITEENLDRFLTEGGKVDLLIEECDSVAVKIIARQRAKAHRIPVVMDTSDRGMIDVERFDLEPDRPILHGLVEHLDAPKGTEVNPELNRALSMALIDPAMLSARMRESLPLIGRNLSSWPQLASAVMMGGGAACDAARRILLGQLQSSGRWFVDAAELMKEQSFDAVDQQQSLT